MTTQEAIQRAVYSLYDTQEEGAWQLKRIAFCMQLSKLMLDVADSFVQDVDHVLNECKMNVDEENKKEVKKIRSSLGYIHRKLVEQDHISFTGGRTEQYEDMSQEIYELVKAYIEQTDNPEDFQSVLKVIKKRRLNKHIFTKN